MQHFPPKCITKFLELHIKNAESPLCGLENYFTGHYLKMAKLISCSDQINTKVPLLAVSLSRDNKFLNSDQTNNQFLSIR